MEEILKETEHLLTRGRMEVPLSLCFAATRNDDQLLHQLLRHGSDPNEIDNNGRTAMVCTFMLGKNFHEMRSSADFLSLYANSISRHLWEAIVA